MHLDDEQIQRTLHNELTPAHSAAREHLESCAACRSRLAREIDEERRIFGLLEAADRPAPYVTLATIAARAERSRRGWRARVAAIVTGLAVAGVAYAAPGSPLPGLIRRALGLMSERPTANPVATRQTETPSLTPDAVSGIAVTPGARFTIDVDAADATATVSLTDGTEVVVRATGGQPSFVSDVGRLAVRNTSGVRRVEIEVPRKVRTFTLRVGERTVFSKNASSVVSEARRDASGRYVLDRLR